MIFVRCCYSYPEVAATRIVQYPESFSISIAWDRCSKDRLFGGESLFDDSDSRNCLLRPVAVLRFWEPVFLHFANIPEKPNAKSFLI
jgi:hypothetical protein